MEAPVADARVTLSPAKGHPVNIPRRRLALAVRLAAFVVTCAAENGGVQARGAEALDVGRQAIEAAREDRILQAARLVFGRAEELDQAPPPPPRLTQTQRAELKIALLSKIDVLRSGLAADDLATRVASARALAFIEDRASALSVSRLLDDDDPVVRIVAAVSLSEIGSVENEKRLSLAASDPDRRVRASALYAMRRLMVGEAAAVRALRDEMVDVREQAANLLAEVRPLEPKLVARTAGALREALSDESRVVRSAAATALGRLGEPGLVPALMKATSDGDDAVANAAVCALGDLGGKAAAEGLIAISARGGERALHAAEALGRCGVRSNGVVDVLSGLVRDAPDATARAAVRALGVLGGERAVEALRAAARGERRELLADIAKAAAHLGNLEPAGVLLRQLSDHDRWKALSAARGLAVLGNPAGFPVFIRALESDDAKMRAYAAACLALYTGTNMDYVPNEDGKNRGKIVWAWKRWWQRNRETFVLPRGGALGVP